MGISFVKELFTGSTTLPSSSHESQEISSDDRLVKSSSIRALCRDKIPVIVEISESSTNIPHLADKKYLVPKNITMGHLISVIRSRINLGPEFAIFVFVNKQPICLRTIISTVYDNYKDKNGFLYVTLTSENAL